MQNTNTDIQNIFQKLFQNSLKHQPDNNQKKINFLKKEAYDFFLKQSFENIINSTIEVNPFLKDLIDNISINAKAKANQAVLNIIEKNDVDYCYKKRLQDFKNQLNRAKYLN